MGGWYGGVVGDVKGNMLAKRRAFRRRLQDRDGGHAPATGRKGCIMADLQVGDVVRLKTDTTRMVLVQLRFDGERADCEYMVDGEHKTAQVAVAALCKCHPDTGEQERMIAD